MCRWPMLTTAASSRSSRYLDGFPRGAQPSLPQLRAGLALYPLVALWSWDYNSQKTLGAPSSALLGALAPGPDGNYSSSSLQLMGIRGPGPQSRAITCSLGALTLLSSPQACNYPLELYEVSTAGL